MGAIPETCQQIASTRLCLVRSSANVSLCSRRQHERSFKTALAGQCLVPGASVAAIALARGVNANPLFKWYGDQMKEQFVAKTSPPHGKPGRYRPDDKLLAFHRAR